MAERAALLKMFQSGRLFTSEPEHREFIKAELALLATNPDKGDYQKYSQMYQTEVEVEVKKEPPVKKAGRPKKS